MNKIASKFLLAREKFLLEMQLRKSGFINSACGLFARNKEKMQIFKETGDSRYIYQTY